MLGARPHEIRALETPEQRHQLEAFASQMAMALERALLAEEAHTAQVRMDTEKLRSSLLSSVSHDLRTPLAAITGAASSLLQAEASLDPGTRQELIESVRDEADRLSRLVQNLLDMTRLESGAIVARMEWHALEDALGPALQRLAPALGAPRLNWDTRGPSFGPDGRRPGGASPHQSTGQRRKVHADWVAHRDFGERVEWCHGGRNRRSGSRPRPRGG